VSARVLAYSPVESERFGFRVFRGSAERIDVAALRDEIDDSKVDIAIVRVPAGAMNLVATLDASGLPSLVADALVHYAGNVATLDTEPPRDATLRLYPIVEADRDTLASTARAVFDGYVSHYHANRLFDRAKVLDGYVEWASRFATGEVAGCEAALIDSGGEIAGFSCIETTRDGAEMRGILNGVLPAFRGRGVYRDMLRTLLRRCRDAGIGRFSIATQVQNVAVQRVWMSEGLMIERAEATIHIDARRSAYAGR
jgi:GNAT superfamily N-acetyltransferase